LLVIGTVLLSSSGFGLLDHLGSKFGSHTLGAVAAPLAANGGNGSGSNSGGGGSNNSGSNNGGSNSGGGSNGGNNSGGNNGGNNGNDNNGNGNGNNNKNKNDNKNGNSDGDGNFKEPKSPKQPAPASPPGQQIVSQGPCTFVLGFAYLHSLLGGRDGACADNEHDDPNGTGDRVQTTRLPNGAPGYMVWQLLTNTMRWTEGYTTFTYSKCGLQQRLNSQTFAWEQNLGLMQQPGPIPPPGACNLV
jgi:hypothetical protein